MKALFFEFMRYAMVGAVSFLVDFGTLVATNETIFRRFDYGLYIATVCGFIAGLTVNYSLSFTFVFSLKRNSAKGRMISTFLVFCVIGLFGLLLTELGMWMGVELLGWNYMLVKITVTTAVLLWNYLGRKKMVFS